MGILLFIIAYVLILPLTLINFLIVRNKSYFKDTAISIDIFANREYRATWNKFLKKENGYEFGRIGETISSAIGKNKRDNTLTNTGKFIANILDFIDKNHCIKSIKDITKK